MSPTELLDFIRKVRDLGVAHFEFEGLRVALFPKDPTFEPEPPPPPEKRERQSKTPRESIRAELDKAASDLYGASS